MGRTREFDIDQAARTAAELFWRNGYDGTSVHDLTTAMGIKPPSFYAAFGCKEALFLRVVKDYQEAQMALFDHALGQPTVAGVVDALLMGYVDAMTDGGLAPGCLILNSALPVVDGHPFRNRFVQDRATVRAMLRDRLAQGAGGDAPGGFDPDALAQLLVTMMWGLAVEAQSGVGKASLGAAAAALSETLRRQLA